MPDLPPRYLTVAELADMLRVKERKVYDMAAAGDVPCLRVTGKLLFPEAELRRWVAGAVSGTGRLEKPRPPIVLGSHDPLLEWALRQSRAGLASFFDGSADGLSRFGAGEGMATGLHLHDPAQDGWNLHAVSDAPAADGSVLVGWAIRQRGLVLPKGLAGQVQGPGDLAGLRMVPRQPGSGTQTLFDALVAQAGLTDTDMHIIDPAPDEAEAVAAVARGEADVAFGLEALAHPLGLAFVPLVAEQFDLLVDRRAWFDPPFQRFWALCTGPALARHATGLAGYDLTPLGQVRWNGADVSPALRP
jgi:excisionase family DNA binding protein